MAELFLRGLTKLPHAFGRGDVCLDDDAVSSPGTNLRERLFRGVQVGSVIDGYGDARLCQIERAGAPDTSGRACDDSMFACNAEKCVRVHILSPFDYFKAPAVNPLTRFFCIKKLKISAGTIRMTASVAMSVQ